MSDTDPLAAELAAIEYRQENGDLRDFVTHDSPRLLAAVEAALKFHQPFTRGDEVLCGACLDSYGEHDEWPCDEYRAITAALLGKDDTDPAAEIEPPRTETDCACGDDCPCDANGPDGLCACCRNGDHDGRCGPLGGSTNPTPDCGGPRKPPGATVVWWCDTHREFHGTKEATDG